MKRFNIHDVELSCSIHSLAFAAGGECAGGTFVVERTQGHLLDVVAARRFASRLASRLHSGQKHSDQNADDRNDNQKLHKREAPSLDARQA